jgi:recombination protein RecT
LLNTVKNLVDRAKNQNAFEACKEVMVERIKDPSELAYALDELDKAKAQPAPSEAVNQ